MSDLDQFLPRVQRIFSEELNLSVPSTDTDLFEEGLLDSLSFVDLLTHLESQFGLQVELEHLEFDNFRTISRIVAFVVDFRNKTQPGAAGAECS